MLEKEPLQKARTYVEENCSLVNKQYVPKFHLAPPLGWMNDPNGFSKYQEEYHLFYQYNPYDSVWGTIHWGHAKSRDGITWEHLPVALAPDQIYDRGGCYSGSAIEKDGILYLMYTGHIEDEPGKYEENQNIAFSEDGIHFQKYENNPVLTNADVPEGTSRTDFRDPKVFERDGEYYCLIGSKTTSEEGQILLYRSKDLFSWEYVSIFLEPHPALGKVAECPDLLLFPEKDYLFVSAADVNNGEEIISHISYAIAGKVDWEKKKFIIQEIQPIDSGLDFYAPQTLKEADHYLMVAWMQHWRRTFPTNERNHHWLGQMTLPRMLTLQNGEWHQAVIPSIQEHLQCISKKNNQVFEIARKLSEEMVNYLYLEISAEELRDFSIAFGNEREHVSLSFSHKENQVHFNRGEMEQKIYEREIEKSRSHFQRKSLEKPLIIECYMDTSSIEVIIDQSGSLSSTFYFATEELGISWQSFEPVKIQQFSIAKMKIL